MWLSNYKSGNDEPSPPEDIDIPGGSAVSEYASLFGKLCGAGDKPNPVTNEELAKMISDTESKYRELLAEDVDHPLLGLYEKQLSTLLESQMERAKVLYVFGPPVEEA